MARKSSKLTSAELNDLKEIGWSEDTPFNIPENINPALKAKIIEAYSEQEGVQNPAYDLPDATYRQNARVRERLAAEGDEDMQKVTGVSEGQTVDTKRQGDLNK